MKALVVSNCATSAYVGGLKNLFPDWEVRGVLQSLAEEWATPTCPNLSFVEYARNCDLHIGLPSAGTRYSQLLPERAQFVAIPHFSFRGLQPDCFHLTGFSSVLRAGNLYSRIVVASFKAGLTPALTCRLFNAKTYETFDLINCYEVEKQNLIAHFGQYRIDLSDSLERWIARGNFLYSYNHPRVDVLIEILRRALVASGFIPISELECNADMGIADELSESIVWPIYPEIAKLHGLDGSLTWRLGRSGGYQTLSLDQFVEASFDALAAMQLPDLTDLPAWVNWIRSLAARGCWE
jgi:hypothetical protein